MRRDRLGEDGLALGDGRGGRRRRLLGGDSVLGEPANERGERVSARAQRKRAGVVREPDEDRRHDHDRARNDTRRGARPLHVLTTPSSSSSQGPQHQTALCHSSRPSSSTQTARGGRHLVAKRRLRGLAGDKCSERLGEKLGLILSDAELLGRDGARAVAAGDACRAVRRAADDLAVVRELRGRKADRDVDAARRYEERAVSETFCAWKSRRSKKTHIPWCARNGRVVSAVDSWPPCCEAVDVKIPQNLPTRAPEAHRPPVASKKAETAAGARP